MSAPKVVNTSDGGFVMTGNYGVGALFLLKTDNAGVTQWTQVYTLPDCYTADDIVETSSGNFVVTGVTKNSQNVKKYYVLLVTAQGTLIWLKTYDPSPFYDLASEGFAANTVYYGSRATKVRQSADGGFLFSGYVLSGQDQFIQLTKIDGAGNLVWSSVTEALISIIAYDMDLCPGNKVNDEEKIYFVIDNAKSFQINEFSGSGTPVWSKEYSCPGKGLYPTCIHYTDDNSLLVGGYCQGVTPPVTKDLILFKSDTAGTVLWFNRYDGLAPDEWASSIDDAPGGNYVAAYGQGVSSAGLINITAAGNIVWGNMYNNIPGYSETNAISVTSTSDGGYAFSGFSTPLFIFHHVFFVKTDAAGDASCYTTPVTFTSAPLIPAVYINPLGSPTTVTATPLSATQNAASFTENLLCSQLLGVNDLPAEEYELYPNPASGVLHLVLPESIESIEIVNELGQEVLSTTVTATHMQLDISFLSPGLYFLRARNASGQSETRKLLIN